MFVQCDLGRNDGQTYGFSRISGEEFASISGQLLVEPSILASSMSNICSMGNLLPLGCLRSEVGDRKSRGQRGPNTGKVSVRKLAAEYLSKVETHAWR